MSEIKWIIPNYLDKYIDIYNCLSESQKYNFNIFCFYCSQLKIYLPIEIKKLILIKMIPIKYTNILLEDILRWWDDFILNPVQNKYNPILLLPKDLSEYNYYNYGYCLVLLDNIDILYSLFKLKLNSYFETSLPEYGELILGIIKDPRILSIEIIIDTNKFNIPVQNLYEYQLTNIYNYNLDDIIYIKKNNKNIFDKKYKRSNNLILWSFREIMPLFLYYSFLRPILINIESIEPIENIILLYGLLNNKFYSEIKKLNTQYKICNYCEGWLSIYGQN